MSVSILLGTPSTFAFQAFSESTSEALDLLAPVADLQDTSPTARAIVAQVRRYIDAIQSGFAAAQYGYTVADDIVSFSQVLDSSTQKEREDYIIGTLELANQAYTASHDSSQAFQNIGATMTFLINKYTDELKSGHVEEMNGGSEGQDMSRVQNLGSRINVLENFAAHASALAGWWEWVKVEINPQRPQPSPHAKVSPVSLDFESLRQRSVIQMWILLKKQFADYVNMGRRLQYAHPKIMTNHVIRSWSNRSQSSNMARTDLQQALSMIRDQRRHDQYKILSIFSNAGNALNTQPEEKTSQMWCGCIVM